MGALRGTDYARTYTQVTNDDKNAFPLPPAPFTGHSRPADNTDSARQKVHIATAACSGLSGQRGRADRY